MSLLRGGDAADASVAAPRRRGLRRALVALNVVLLSLVVLAGGGLAYALVQNGRLDRIDVDDPDGDGKTLAEVRKGDPVNILVVGSDTRAFAETRQDKAQFGARQQGDSARSDTMMVVRLQPKDDRVTVLSIARDLWVDVDGGGKDRINAAFTDPKDATKADPGRLVRTITKNFGIPINHYVEVDFGGFREVVDAIGGVKVYFPSPARDPFSLLDVRQSGCVSLDGKQALAYVRSRHYEYKDERGRWRTDPSGDIGRIQRQQDFMQRVVRKSIKEGLTNPVKAFGLIEAGIDNVRVDKALSLSKLKDLAAQLKDLGEEGTTFLALTGEPYRTPGGADVLRVTPSTANPVLVAFGGRPLPGTTASTGRTTGSTAASALPAGTTVVLANGAGTTGLVAQTQAALRELGVATSSAGNAPTTDVTEVRHRAGSEKAAQAVQGHLQGQTKLVVDASLKAGQVKVVLGRSFTGVKAPAAPGSAASTTTTAGPVPTTQPPKGSDPSVTC